MRLIADIAGDRHELNIRRDGTRLDARIDERSYEAEAHDLGAGRYLLIVEGHVYECRLEWGARAGGFDAQVEGQVYAVSLSDPKRLRGAQASGAHSAEGAAEIVAPMPGKIVRVLVAQGAQVEAGEGLVVVEAMKMQNEMKSPKAGTVASLHAEVGATVNAGDVLVIVE